MKIIFAFVAALVLAACDSSEAGSADLGVVDIGADIVIVDSPTDSPIDSPLDSPADAPITDAPSGVECGSVTCGTAEVCVVPCCGGAPGDMGCTPAAPFCAPDSIIATCSGGSSCAQCSVGGGNGSYDSRTDTIRCLCF